MYVYVKLILYSPLPPALTKPSYTLKYAATHPRLKYGSRLLSQTLVCLIVVCVKSDLLSLLSKVCKMLLL